MYNNYDSYSIHATINWLKEANTSSLKIPTEAQEFK